MPRKPAPRTSEGYIETDQGCTSEGYITTSTTRKPSPSVLGPDDAVVIDLASRKAKPAWSTPRVVEIPWTPELTALAA
jgi:hypothetical protein